MGNITSPQSLSHPVFIQSICSHFYLPSWSKSRTKECPSMSSSPVPVFIVLPRFNPLLLIAWIPEHSKDMLAFWPPPSSSLD